MTYNLTQLNSTTLLAETALHPPPPRNTLAVGLSYRIILRLSAAQEKARCLGDAPPTVVEIL